MGCSAPCPHCFEDVATGIYFLARMWMSHRTPCTFPLHLRAHWIQRKPSLVHSVPKLAWSWRECRWNKIILAMPLFWFFSYLWHHSNFYSRTYEFCAALASCRKKKYGLVFNFPLSLLLGILLFKSFTQPAHWAKGLFQKCWMGFCECSPFVWFGCPAALQVCSVTVSLLPPFRNSERGEFASLHPLWLIYFSSPGRFSCQPQL